MNRYEDSDSDYEDEDRDCDISILVDKYLYESNTKGTLMNILTHSKGKYYYIIKSKDYILCALKANSLKEIKELDKKSENKLNDVLQVLLCTYSKLEDCLDVKIERTNKDNINKLIDEKKINYVIGGAI